MRAARIVLGLVGMVLAVVGVTRNDRRFVWGAIAVLIVALVFRLTGRFGKPDR